MYHKGKVTKYVELCKYLKGKDYMREYYKMYPKAIKPKDWDDK